LGQARRSRRDYSPSASWKAGPRRETASFGLGHPDLAPRDRFIGALRSSATAQRHQRNLDDALAAGAFGVPTLCS
jgi:hypothetical protein